MRLLLLAIGRLRGCEKEQAAEYLKRAAPLLRRMGLTSVEMRDFPESRAADAAGRRRQEGQTLLRAAGKDAVLVVLDERGEVLSSREFSTRLARLAGGGRNLAIIIGGPDGLDEELKDKARLSVSFGRMTWPHRLVRVMAAEQIYRAATIAAGHPYHRD